MLVNIRGIPYLCDFGLSRLRHNITRTHTTIRSGGRLRLVAPEVSSATLRRAIELSDIYSFAMTILALGTGETPFSSFNNQAADRMASKGRRPPIPSSLHGLDAVFTERMGQLLSQMWVHEASLRWLSKQVVKELESISGQYEDSEAPPTHQSPQSLDTNLHRHLYREL